MDTPFTQEDLICYLYDELDPTFREALRKDLITDERLRQSYRQVQAVHHLLDLEWRHPSQASVDIIMDYSKSFSSLETY
jgi:anti-sigma factor RsiW